MQRRLRKVMLMKKLSLTQNRFALVDDQDYDWLMQWKWHALRQRTGNWYAVRSEGKWPNRTLVYMHDAIMAPPKGFRVDHRKGDGLDNRREMLRVCTNYQNNQNARKRKDNSSGYKGVTWNKVRRKYQARIQVNHKSMSLGYYDDPANAANAYDVAARKHFGDYARTNF